MLPLYLKQVVETTRPMDLYTVANPLVIVCFQLLVTTLFGKMKPIRSIVVGTVIIGAVHGWSTSSRSTRRGGVRGAVPDLLPLGSLFIILTVALIAFGELFTSARTYEYIGALAPKGQEGLFLGYANLPMAIGSLVGGPVGALIFNEVMCQGRDHARPTACSSWCRRRTPLGWLILMAIGFVSALACGCTTAGSRSTPSRP